MRGRRSSHVVAVGRYFDAEQQEGPSAPVSTNTTSTAASRPVYGTIYDRNDCSKTIDQLKAMGRDDNASVATLIGYSYCKLGDYRLAQV